MSALLGTRQCGGAGNGGRRKLTGWYAVRVQDLKYSARSAHANAGAVAVMALERVPSDIRAEGGVARMCNPEVIQSIQETVEADGRKPIPKETR